MAEITKPIALDESFNTTEGSPRNVADVLAQGIGDLVTVVSRISHQTTYDELSDLEDVNISTPTNGDVLTYDGSKWVNGQGGGGASVEQMIAPVETSTTASQSYAIGEQFIFNGTLYTATAAITAGGTITIGGNCTASDTVTEQIERNHTQGKLVAEVVGNGTKTYAQLLAELETAVGNYDLTYTVLNLGGNIGQISNAASKQYCAVESNATRLMINTTNLSAHTYITTQSAVGGATTSTNQSNNAVPNGRNISIYNI